MAWRPEAALMGRRWGTRESHPHAQPRRPPLALEVRELAALEELVRVGLPVTAEEQRRLEAARRDGVDRFGRPVAGELR